MRKSNSSIVRLMIIVCCVGLFSLSLPIQVGASLNCQSSKVLEVKLWPNQGLVGAHLELTSGPSVIWVLCNLDSFGIGERRCNDILTLLNIAKVADVPIRFSFSDSVPDSNGNPALACSEIVQWTNLELNFSMMSLLETP